MFFTNSHENTHVDSKLETSMCVLEQILKLCQVSRILICCSALYPGVFFLSNEQELLSGLILRDENLTFNRKGFRKIRFIE